MVLGNTVVHGGRMNEEASVGLAKTIEDLKFNIGRLKTGSTIWNYDTVMSIVLST